MKLLLDVVDAASAEKSDWVAYVCLMLTLIALGVFSLWLHVTKPRDREWKPRTLKYRRIR